MTREELIEQAGALTQPGAAHVREYEACREIMVAELNRLMNGRPDIEQLIGAGNFDMMCDNHQHHALFMGSLLIDYKPEAFVNTVIWVLKSYRAHGFSLRYWDVQLEAWLGLLQRHLSAEAYAAIHPFYAFILSHQPHLARLGDSS
ncbi:hypothetical protein CKO15_08610 [Halorhodospira abdelmalekii]|uniref:hypothetical protein n=1 Tax=Halorhodospira abdelmalekii TaxID=421629 RepID=UPI0019053FD9|nr:hypothetical protein [Halorhodospira abdelmalekii]MBK1735342.1 hypothetical protein [Halorhodospira abdelmalekii]